MDSHGIVPSDKGDVVEQTAKDLSEQTAPAEKMLRISKEEDGTEFKRILAQVLQYVDIGKTLEHIEKEKQYVVQVPLKYQKALDEGKLFMNTSKKTGTMWPELVEIAPNGQHKFVDNLPVVDQELVQGNPFHDISANLYNIALQQQLADIADTMEKTYAAVQRIEQWQEDTTVAGLNSGREQIQLALKVKDPVERKRGLSLGRSKLVDAKNAFALILKSRVEAFKEIPKEKLKQRWMAFKHPDVWNERDAEVEKLQEYYDLFLETTKLIAFSYFLIGEEDAAEQTFRNSINSINEINFKRLCTSRFIHKSVEFRDWFMFRPVAYIEDAEENMKEYIKEYDYMLIDVSGKEFLEVLKDGETV